MLGTLADDLSCPVQPPSLVLYNYSYSTSSVRTTGGTPSVSRAYIDQGLPPGILYQARYRRLWYLYMQGLRASGNDDVMMG